MKIDEHERFAVDPFLCRSAEPGSRSRAGKSFGPVLLHPGIAAKRTIPSNNRSGIDSSLDGGYCPMQLARAKHLPQISGAGPSQAAGPLCPQGVSRCPWCVLREQCGADGIGQVQPIPAPAEATKPPPRQLFCGKHMSKDLVFGLSVLRRIGDDDLRGSAALRGRLNGQRTAAKWKPHRTLAMEL
jgi:hypothetical protein